MTADPQAPLTEAGRALLDSLTLLDALDPAAKRAPIDWSDIIAAVEAEAAANERARLAARVEVIRPSHSHPVGPDRLCLAPFCPAGMQDAVLRLLRKGAA